MARRPIIAGNWKMHMTVGEALSLANGLRRELCDLADVEIVLCPPFTALDEVNEIIQDSNLKLGAQDLHWEDQGAFTGEISSVMLKDVGCQYVIVGHSERRQHFEETNEMVNKKVKAALRHGLMPIVCVGETLKERESAETFAVIQRHLEEGLQGLTSEELSRCVIAYEPVWAIGTGKNATPGQAQEVHAFIRNHLVKLSDATSAQAIRIQYGGSVRPDNIHDLMAQEDVDGALVGGASLNVESFATIVKSSVLRK